MCDLLHCLSPSEVQMEGSFQIKMINKLLLVGVIFLVLPKIRCSKSFFIQFLWLGLGLDSCCGRHRHWRTARFFGLANIAYRPKGKTLYLWFVAALKCHKPFCLVQSTLSSQMICEPFHLSVVE